MEPDRQPQDRPRAGVPAAQRQRGRDREHPDQPVPVLRRPALAQGNPAVSRPGTRHGGKCWFWPLRDERPGPAPGTSKRPARTHLPSLHAQPARRVRTDTWRQAMTSQSSPAIGRAGRAAPLRSWRTAVGLTAAAGGATIAAAAFLPWVSAFAGLIQVPGVRGSNGRIMLAAGIVIAAAGLYHVIRGGTWSRWLVGLAGGGALAFSGYLLIRLTQSIRALGGDSMVIARGGPGLRVAAAGSLGAFATLFLPSSSQVTLMQQDRSHGILAWAADRESLGARRWLQIGLGLTWLLDAAPAVPALHVH